MKQYLVPKTILGTLVLTLFLGVISSALWDLLFKPGVTGFGRILLSIFTFGSETIRDFAYANAATDPTPLPALVGILFVSWVPVFLMSTLMGKVTGRRSSNNSIMRAQIAAAGDDEKLIELLKENVNTLQKKLILFTAIFLMIFGVITVTSSFVLYQSVTVWRVFHADIAICAPHITSLEEKQFQARFAMMTTRGEYMAISRDLDKIAKKNGVNLVNIPLW